MHPSMMANIKRIVSDSGVRFEVFQEMRHELHLVALRLRQHYSPTHRRRCRQLRERTDVRLHFGCGRRILPGWVNLDAYACEGISVELDLQGSLPLSDGSVHWIFTEHVLEHIDRRRIGGIFREFQRVLEPGGVARILVPDLDFYCRAYLAGDVKAITTPLPDTHTTAEAVNSVFNDHFHRFIYDFATLRFELAEAGFTDVVRCEYGQSRHPGLALDSDLDSRRVGTLCVEATRH